MYITRWNKKEKARTKRKEKKERSKTLTRTARVRAKPKYPKLHSRYQMCMHKSVVLLDSIRFFSLASLMFVNVNVILESPSA